MITCYVCISLFIDGFIYKSYGPVGIWKGPWHNVMCQQLSGFIHFNKAEK